MHTLKPLDEAAIICAAASETGAIVTVEEHSVLGGLGGAVAEVLAESGISPVRFKRIGLPSEFAKYVGSQEYLRAQYGALPEPSRPRCAKVDGLARCRRSRSGGSYA